MPPLGIAETSRPESQRRELWRSVLRVCSWRSPIRGLSVESRMIVGEKTAQPYQAASALVQRAGSDAGVNRRVKGQRAKDSEADGATGDIAGRLSTVPVCSIEGEVEVKQGVFVFLHTSLHVLLSIDPPLASG